MPVARVAVAQAAPAFFDRDAAVERVRALATEAAAGGAQLIVFPEAYIPAYPRGLSFGAAVGSRTAQGRRLWARYWDNSVPVPGPTTGALARIARQANAHLAIGVIEQDGEFGRGTLYCTLLYFSPQGELLGKHRKLMPTAAERLIWGQGDGSTLPVFETPLGRLGGLICWENYMPLARMALYVQGVQIYLAPTADARATWQATLQHIACEGRCFVLGCNQFMTRSMIPADLGVTDELAAQPEIMCRGGSAILSPLGEYLAGPLYDEEGILYADLDLALVAQGKYDFDVAGHYARPDVFQLTVNQRPQPPVAWIR
jgi:nitrilase